MKNRPLCSLCLVIAILIGILTVGAGAKFVSELRPSPVEQYGEKDDWLIVRGQVYKKRRKRKVSDIISEKMFCLFSERSTESTKSTKSAIVNKRIQNAHL